MNSNLAELMEDEFEETVKHAEEAELIGDALTLYDQARALRVSDQGTYAAAGNLAKTLKDMTKEITDFFAPMKKSAYDAWKVICNKETETLQPVKDADALVRKSMTVYLDEQERIRKEEERKARVAAEEAAKKEQARLLAQAEKAEAAGKTEKAESLQEKAENVYVAPVYVAPAVEKTVDLGNGSVTRKSDVKCTVTDIKALCAEVAAGRAPESIMEAKPAALKSWVKLHQIKQCPGVHIEEVSSVSIR